MPKAGSSYTYCAAVLGEVVGWIVGFDLLLESTAIVAVVAVVAIGMSGYLGFLLDAVGIHLPTWALGAPGTGAGHRIDLLAVAICLAVAWLLARGTRTSARVETVLTIVKIAIVLVVIVVGFIKVDSGNLTPFAPFGLGGAFTSMVLYVLVCVVLTGIQHYSELNPNSGISSAFADVGLNGLANVIAVGAVIGIVTVTFSFIMIFSGWLMPFLQWETWVRVGAWLVAGLVVYGAYGYRRTRQVMPGGSVDLDTLDDLDDTEGVLGA
ncbi:hypothetical protein M271_03425 [Streptomyces rapamycinicus NRRL 5491]|uniref:APA family basic amino acid/polyamine antiporter n=1 Tax=Streptomyces rapamycinicus TaxID=1226757 RepID=A0ABR6LDC3_9ACTN|nr:hypothetical protein M271_03425 [Streptomyces rapamycinicus NRRL 5491]MBB4779777.1 APA family basic amino acid/polyamine antiporter [Streptomyces rapamycinicus]